MVYKRTILALVAAGLTLATSVAGARNNILSLKHSITDNDIVPPESFETDTHKLMNNWYMRNYVEIDDDLLANAGKSVSDEEYTKRLQAMPTTIEMPFNSIVKQYIEMYLFKKTRLVEEMLAMSHYYMPIFEAALERHGLPLELKYLPIIESALDPTATSRTGAGGLWQFMPGTGKGLGLELNSLLDERRDTYKSSEAAAVLLGDLYQIYNDWSLAIAAYNCGPGNVNKALRRAGGTGKQDFWDVYYYLPKETRGYVPCFIAACYVMTYYQKHGIKPALMKKALVTDTIVVTNRIHFDQISHVLNIPVDELQVLNPQYRANIIPGDYQACTLILPSQQVSSFIMSQDSILAYRSSVYTPRATAEPGGSSASVDEGSGDTPAPQYTYRYEHSEGKHRVRRGENLAQVASAYGMSQDQLVNMNPSLKRNRKLRRGQILRVMTTRKVKVPVEQDVAAAAATGGDRESVPSEQEQINEVLDVQKQAIERASYKGSRRVDVDTDNEKHTSRAEKQTSASRADKQTSKRTREQRPAAPKTVTHSVKKGESLGSIAGKYGMSVSELKKLNGLKRETIVPGQKLKVKGASAAAPKVKGTSSAGKGKTKTKAKSTRKRRR